MGTEALFWGILSAVSLPLGAVIGLLWPPRRLMGAAFTAFGAGALLFALTIELFARVPHYVEEHGLGILVASVIGAISGGVLFAVLNQLLNNRGAFLRRLSHARGHLSRLRRKRTRELVEELSRIELLSAVKPEHMAQLFRRVRRQLFKEGKVIFRPGDKAREMYFVVSGEVAIYREEQGNQPVAVMKMSDTFGEMAILRNQPHSAEARAATDVRVYTIVKEDLDAVLALAPELQSAFEDLNNSRMREGQVERVDPNSEWRDKTLVHLAVSEQPISVAHIREEGQAVRGGALAIWLGILIDGIPESLVIGMLTISSAGVSIAFIVGVFLANLPEAMTSAVSMRTHGMKVRRIMLMWTSICVMTGIGAFIGAVILPPHPTGAVLYFVLGVEGLAAGAMLTMIAEVMLPEAFEQGGSIVGLSTLAGFLTTLAVKVL